VQIWELGKSGNKNNAADPDLDDWRTESKSFVAIAWFRPGSEATVLVGNSSARAQVSPVSARFFDVLGVRPMRGRAFGDDEVREGGALAVLVSERFWRERLAGNPAVVGTTLSMNATSFMVVGVVPEAVDFPHGADLWVSAEATSEHHTSRTAHNWQVVGRLRDGVTEADADAEVSAITRRAKQLNGTAMDAVDATVVPLLEQMVGKTKPILYLLLGASLVLLLIACANVVNLLVARMASRQGELAVRVALGAGRGRVLQQCLAESLVLSITGAALGVVLAAAGVRSLVRLAPPGLPRVEAIRVDSGVLVFAIGVSVIVAGALAVLAAWRGTRGDIRETLSQSGRAQARGTASLGLRRVLVVAQVAMTLVLLVGAALLGRSLVQLLRVDPGFRTDNLAVLDLTIPKPGGDSATFKRRAQDFEDIMARMRAIPGVTHVGGVSTVPFGGGGNNGGFVILDRPITTIDPGTDMKAMIERLRAIGKQPGRSGYAEYRLTTPGYFDAMRIPLISGRFFSDADRYETENVAVVSQSLARKVWPAESPIGKYIEYGNMDGDLRTFTIVGVVGDVRDRGFESELGASFYGLYRQRPHASSSINIVMRTRTSPASVIAAAAPIMRALQPDVPARFRTMDSMIARSLADRRFTLFLVGVFGGLALFLATLGVYSVISYLVAQRRRELSIRLALGARAEDVVRLVLRQGAGLAFVGVGVGLVASFGLTRLIAKMLFDVTATDPLVFAGVTALLVLAALLASYLPARRAGRADAVDVLRAG
jgi:predicted permease